MMDVLTQVISDYNEAVFDTDRERALRVVNEAVERGVGPEEVVFRVVLPSMDHMIKALTERKCANVAQHFVTAQIANEATAAMLARFEKAPEARGRVVIGNSFGDFHALGKRIVIACLKARLLEVVDLGTNVRPEVFVDAAVARDAHVIAISSMMVHTARGENGSQRVQQLLKERGLDSKIKTIVGGAPYRFDRDLYKTVKADAWAEDAVAAGKVIEELVREARV
jgi:trimethylamine corrinoid protein